MFNLYLPIICMLFLMPTLGGYIINATSLNMHTVRTVYIPSYSMSLRIVATAAHIKSFYGGDRSRTIFITIPLFEHKSVVKTDTNNLRNAQVNMENVYIF